MKLRREHIIMGMIQSALNQLTLGIAGATAGIAKGLKGGLNKPAPEPVQKEPAKPDYGPTVLEGEQYDYTAKLGPRPYNKYAAALAAQKSGNDLIGQKARAQFKSAEERVKDFYKDRQLSIINATNPMLDDYHVGIRTVKDIKSWDEVLKGNDDDQFAWGDFSRKDAEEAAKAGKIKVYSSNPIRQGTFVSTSKIQAEEYAGGRGKQVYEKEVPLKHVAWINGDEGQYANIWMREKEGGKK